MQVSDSRYQINKFQELGAQGPDVRFQVSGAQVSGARCQVSGAQVSGASFRT